MVGRDQNLLILLGTEFIGMKSKVLLVLLVVVNNSIYQHIDMVT